MCGIAGIIAPRRAVDDEAIRRMVAAMHHRGPDDAGSEMISAGETDWFLGNTRLSIIDLSSAGHMPMAEPGSGNWITYNGEIYNHPALREDLEKAGERFVSRTDTEVILKLYRREGSRCLNRLRGMFAFAIWDAAKREVFIARDRAGKKPLYYCTPRPGTFAFASEVRTLLASGIVDRKLDVRSLDLFLANGFVVSPLTLVRGVSSLLPGQFMRVDAEGRVIERATYWRPPHAAATGGSNEKETLDDLRHEFREAVRLRLISDVPLGVFLSGGMDSSALLGALGRDSGDIRTFSIAFPERDFDESAFSRQVASFWKTQHTEVVIGRAQFLEWLPEALAAIDQPSFDGVNTYLVSRAAREAGLKVAISGIGADEIFGGYPFFKGVPSLQVIARAASPLSSLIRGLTRPLTEGPRGLASTSYFWTTLELLSAAKSDSDRSAGSAIGAYQAAQVLFPSWARRTLLARSLNGSGPGEAGSPSSLPREFLDFLKEDVVGLDPVSATSLLTWRLFLGERCLRDTDAMSMGVSLEVRAPFTDHIFVEKALALPGRLRCAGAPDKPYERRALAPYLDGAWRPRGKQGFVLPFRHWLSEASGRERIHEVLADGASLRRAGLDVAAVETLRKRHAAAPASVPWSRIWALHALVDWCRRSEVSL